MNRTIELPDRVYSALQDAARTTGMTPADWIAAHLPKSPPVEPSNSTVDPDWLDKDFLRTYADEADDSVSLESVRRALAKIPGSLADDIRAERDER